MKFQNSQGRWIEDDVYFFLIEQSFEDDTKYYYIYTTTKTEWKKRKCCPAVWYSYCPEDWLEIGEHQYSPAHTQRFMAEGKYNMLDLAEDLIQKGYIPHKGLAQFIIELEFEDKVSAIFPDYRK